MSIKNVTQLNDFAMLKGERMPRNRRDTWGCAECGSSLTHEEIMHNSIEGEIFCDFDYEAEVKMNPSFYPMAA